MKRSIITFFAIFFFVATLTNLTSAGGVGISPVHYKEFFEPYLQKTFEFSAFNTNPEKGVKIYVKGDLAQYANISQTYFTGAGSFNVTLKLPKEIEKPGTHNLIVGAIEAEIDGVETIGGIAAIQGRIEIFVPYPGKYAEASFKINDINEGEDAQYELEIRNLGSETITASPEVKIYKKNASEPIIKRTLSQTTIKPKNTIQIIEKLDTKNLPPGEYEAKATVSYETNIIELNKTFRIGEFLVEILDYDYLFEQGKINKFNIQVKNLWNSPISEIYARVGITDEGIYVTDFKTVTTSSEPWQTQNLTGYLDATKLEAKRYVANLLLSYDNETTSKLVAIYVQKPDKKLNYLLYATITALIIIIIGTIIIIYLIKRVKELKNERKNKKQK